MQSIKYTKNNNKKLIYLKNKTNAIIFSKCDAGEEETRTYDTIQK